MLLILVNQINYFLLTSDIEKCTTFRSFMQIDFLKMDLRRIIIKQKVKSRILKERCLLLNIFISDSWNRKGIS
jgi:hypothetical protein